MMTLHLPSKKVLIVTVLILALVPVFLFVGYRNREIITKLPNASLYSDDVVLFYDNNCSHCGKVEDFIKDHNIEKNINFIRLEVLHDSLHANILEDKAQICGLDFEQIGVPFLWDGPHKKCVIGYVDIINFFRQFIVKN